MAVDPPVTGSRAPGPSAPERSLAADGRPLGPLAWQRERPHRWLDAFLAERGLRDLELAIHADDAMLEYSCLQHEGDFDAGLVTYFASGAEVFDTVRRLALARFGGLDRVGRLLDFGAGYGRLTRYLVRELPAERITVSDLLDDAVEFQRRCFGVGGRSSHADPAALDWDDRFDLIWVGSLFTHLPEGSFSSWLAALARRLAPGGMLAFTVHDARLVPPGHRLSERGILFLPESESRALDPEQYGSTWVSESFVERAVARVAEATGRELHHRRIERGVCRHQELYLVADSDVELDALEIDPGPRALLEHARIPEPGTLELSGWACYVGEPFRVESVEARLDAEPVGRCERLGERPDLVDILESEDARHSEFAFRLPLPSPLSKSTTILSVAVHSSSGRVTPLFLGSVDRALYETARANWVGKRREVRALERYIEWMKSSRFWRLRERWFALKRALGLTDER